MQCVRAIFRKSFSGLLLGLLTFAAAQLSGGQESLSWGQEAGSIPRQPSDSNAGVAGDSSSQSLAIGLNQLAERNYQAAAETLADVVVKKQATVQQLTGRIDAITLLARETRLLQQATVGAGSALRALGRHAEALEFFESAILLAKPSAASEAPASGEDANNGAGAGDGWLSTIKLAAAECAVGAGLHDKAMDFCDEVIKQTVQVNGGGAAAVRPQEVDIFSSAQQAWIRSALAAKQPTRAWERFKEVVELDEIDKRVWQEFALSIGLAALSGNDPTDAQIAFRWYLRHAVDLVDANNLVKRETALLGIAWAAAKGAEPYEVAATRLLDFVQQFPNSNDAPKALLVCGGCLERSEKPEQAEKIYQNLITQYPNSPEAISATGELLRLVPDAEITENIDQSVRLAAAGNSLTAAMIEVLAMAASEHSDEVLWSRLLDTIDSNPTCGSQVSRTLKRLFTLGAAADAERLAMHVLSSKLLAASADRERDSGNCPIEQACRWAAASGHWNMLALAGKQAVADQTIENLNTLTLRLLAEGAIQSADLRTAKVLVDRLIHQRQNRDFDTLLRSAEISLAVDPKEPAGQAINVAEQAAKSDLERALATVLRAQWFIRDARMIEARDALQRVIRGTDVTDDVKARAQWLLGETHFLQRQFVEAINHYRLVEPLDPSGTWTAAALVQAGRSFEQLGRQREAAVCYTGLMTRFSDSPHLQVAQQRLAALGPNGSSTTQGSSPTSGRNEKLR